MEIKFSSTSEKQLKAVSDDVKQVIVSEIEDMVSEGVFKHENVVLVEGKPEGYRLKVKKEGADHRVFFRLGSSSVLVDAVVHRDNAYREE